MNQNNKADPPALKAKILRMSIILGLSLLSGLACSANRHRSVSSEEAKKLVFEALPKKARRLPSLSLEGGLDRENPEFYFFSVMWAGAPNGSCVYGSYAVDASSGDVFDPVLECTEISTPSLRKLQAKIRSRIGLLAPEYHKFKTKGPLCQGDHYTDAHK